MKATKEQTRIIAKLKGYVSQIDSLKTSYAAARQEKAAQYAAALQVVGVQNLITLPVDVTLLPTEWVLLHAMAKSQEVSVGAAVSQLLKSDSITESLDEYLNPPEPAR